MQAKSKLQCIFFCISVLYPCLLPGVTSSEDDLLFRSGGRQDVGQYTPYVNDPNMYLEEQPLFYSQYEGVDWDFSKTPKHLEQIFKGRCHDYQEIMNPLVFIDNQKNCSALWEMFFDAFAYHEECKMSMERYMDFALEARHPVPEHKALMWEGVAGFVHRYTMGGKKYTAVSDTLTGYLGNDINWCGAVDGPGVDYEHCERCDNSAYITFWRQASIQFAQLLTGKVYFMVNGSRPQATRPTSIFATYELPNMHPAKVPVIEVLVVHDPDKPRRESCGEGSLRQLESTIREKGHEYYCTDDPIDVMFMLCSEYPDTLDCRKMTNSANSSGLSLNYWILLAVAMVTFAG